MYQKIKHIHYAWVMCGLGAMMIAISIGVVANGFSIYLPYLITDYGFSNSQTSFLVNIRCVVSFLATLFVGRYYKLFTLRVGITLATSCACIAYLLYGISDSYIIFCLGSAISGLSHGLGAMIPVTVLMNNWFTHRRALAISICAMGSNIGTIFLPPLINTLVQSSSVQKSFFMLSAGVSVMILAIAVLLRNTPEEKGLHPYKFSDSTVTQDTSAVVHTKEQPKMTKKVWLYIGCASLAMGVISNPGFTHLSVLYTTEGYAMATVAWMISGMGIATTIVKPLSGQLVDSWGGFKVTLSFGFFMLIAYTACCFSFTGSTVVCVLTSIFMGCGNCITMLGTSIWAGDLAPKEDYAETVRKLQIIYSGGALCFATVPGILADHFGSYIPAYGLFSALLVISLVCVICAYRESKKSCNTL